MVENENKDNQEISPASNTPQTPKTKIEYIVYPHALPVWDEFYFFPTTDGRLILNGGEC